MSTSVAGSKQERSEETSFGDEKSDDIQKEVSPSKEVPVALVEDTEEEESHGNEEDDASSLDEGELSMPLFQYTRLFGALPRQARAQDAAVSPPLSVPCTCCTMGKVVLGPETMAVSESNVNETPSPHLWQEPIHLTAFGFQDGQVWLTTAQSATAIAGPEKLQVREGGRDRKEIVALVFDATGTILTAIDAGGMCVVWELQYTLQMLTASASTNQQRQQQGNVFSNIMSVLTGGGEGESGDRNNNSAATEPSEPVPTLTLASLQTSRITYPKSFGTPTCLTIDPSYKRRREKALMVGFSDGRLVLTKRGFVFQRRTDTVLYQAVADNDKYFCGIEAIVWRGSLVAWADATGVRLLDADTWTRIAHVDRPTGARPSLYPTVTQLRPQLCFETSHKLLVAWGDCLLRLAIRETAITRHHAPTHTAAGPNSGPAVVRRRTVECTMAWELDCVACGVAPLDEHHVVVLGLVPPLEDQEEDDAERSQHQHQGHNDVELQVVKRADGTIVYSDLLPLLRCPEKSQSPGRLPESALPYRLLSSFALPRMDNATELQAEGPEVDDDFDPLQMSIFSTSDSAPRTFRDSHIKWTLGMVSYDGPDASKQGQQEEAKEAGVTSLSDTNSVDSDDYGFIFRPFSEPAVSDSSGSAVPPMMIITTGSDSVLCRVRDVDDAISFALSEKTPALALQRALGHLQRLRRYDINDLVNEYFRSLLRLPENESEEKEKSGPVVETLGQPSAHLSLRRLKLAAEAMPLLLGGNIDLWQLWVSELERISGALFVVRSYLPVRDPILPVELYGRVLVGMLEEVEQMDASSRSEDVGGLAVEAEGHFLNTLVAWGSTDVLNEHVRLLQYQVELDSSFEIALRALKESLRRRSEQTAAGYLALPVLPSSSENSANAVSTIVDTTVDSKEALFDVSGLISVMIKRVDVVSTKAPGSENVSVTTRDPPEMNSRVALSALAKLFMIEGEFDYALRCFLCIGALRSKWKLDEIEDAAVAHVNSDGIRGNAGRDSTSPFAFVLFFIESHHLHQCILDQEFLSDKVSSTPIFSLLRLVGLELMGDFLVRHCVAPQTTASPASPSQSSAAMSPSDKTVGERRGTLPIDLVVEQLEKSPKLLHWYLNLIFVRKPEVYIKFPNTANPPPVITSLHRKHLELYIKYAGKNRNSTKALEGIEPYRVSETTTPLLSFLKVVLQLGGIRPSEVSKMLEAERKGGTGVSPMFALELAFIEEHFGEDTEAEARRVLALYLKGASSLMLAVAYAQRTRNHSTALWDILINHCLSGFPRYANKSGGLSGDGGLLFGSLLEAAALSGADLSQLVTQIPHGMAVEGLRERLVAAVADYRLKLQMHTSASEVAAEEKIALLRERIHRSRRGMRWELSDEPEKPTSSGPAVEETMMNPAVGSEKPHVLPVSLRTVERKDRHSLSYSLPMR